MICPRCATTMLKRQDGTPYCYPCTESGYRGTQPKPADAIPPIRTGVPQTSLSPQGEAFRLLQERVAKLESAMADLKRRPEPPARPRFLGQLAEEPSLGEPGKEG